MTNDPHRYAALESDWNMGPFYVLVDSNTGNVSLDKETGTIHLYRKVGLEFFAKARDNSQIVRTVTITLVGPPML